MYTASHTHCCHETSCTRSKNFDTLEPSTSPSGCTWTHALAPSVWHISEHVPVASS